jgi:hypothetical protein
MLVAASTAASSSAWESLYVFQTATTRPVVVKASCGKRSVKPALRLSMGTGLLA